MVVKTTPPLRHCSSFAQVLAVCGLHRRLAQQSWQRWNWPKSWSSRSLRSVRTTSVGFSIAGCCDDAAGVEEPSSGSCPSPACARRRRRGGRPLAALHLAGPIACPAASANAVSCHRQLARSVSSTAALTAWNWW